MSGMIPVPGDDCNVCAGSPEEEADGSGVPGVQAPLILACGRRCLLKTGPPSAPSPSNTGFVPESRRIPWPRPCRRVETELTCLLSGASRTL